MSSAHVPGWTVQYVDSVASTNAVAAASARDRLVVVCDHQTAGRGRLDRVWETPPGVALTFSMVCDPGLPDARWPELPLVTGVAVCEALADLTGLRAELKWPNDVMLDDRKLAGILLERVLGAGGPLAVIGIGLNVHQRDLPFSRATSLALAGASVDRAELLEGIVVALDRRVRRRWEGAGLMRDYRRLCSTLGRQVRVELPGKTVEGVVEDLDVSGRLVIDGRAYAAGDVVHATPTSGVSGVGDVPRDSA